jgi:two-component system, chemotaxis family, response regulator Rcp1
MNNIFSSGRVAELLLVDDNEDDVFLTKEAFSSANFMVNLNRVDDGEKCMAYLRKQPPMKMPPRPTPCYSI